MKRILKAKFWMIVALVILLQVQLIGVPDGGLGSVASAKSKTLERMAKYDAHELEFRILLGSWVLRYPDVALALGMTASKYKTMKDLNLYGRQDLQRDAWLLLELARRNPQAIKELLQILGDELRYAYENRLTEQERLRLRSYLGELVDNPDVGTRTTHSDVTAVKFFESLYNITPYGQRIYLGRFPQTTTRYVSTEITYNNKYYNIQEAPFPYVFEYYYPNGTLMGRIAEATTPNRSWKSAVVACGRGWSDPGNWPTGLYTVKVWFDNVYVGQYHFEVY